MKIRIKWSHELVKEESLKYETMSEFKNACPGAYGYSRNNGILDEVCSHLKIRIKWSHELVKEESLKYNTRSEFRNGSRGAYDYAKKYNILDEVCFHMNKLFMWSYETTKEEALKYETRRKFRNGSRDAYDYAKKYNILDEVCSHMKIRIKWSHELVKEEALKYETRNEFKNAKRSAYDYTKRHNILDEVCSHMKKLGNLKKRCIYVCWFPDNHCYIGLTCNIDKRMANRKPIDSVTRHKNKTGLDYEYKMLTDYVDVEEAQRLEGEYVEKYKDNGWEILNRVATGALGKTNKWTIELVTELALKYDKRSHFKNENIGAYSFAKRNNFLDELFPT